MIPDVLFNLLSLLTIVPIIVTVLLAVTLWIGAYAFDQAERRMIS
jgi:hypothetical protein